MFESTMARAARAAELRAAEQARRIADALEAALPADMRVRPEAGGVRLSGRALGRRLALDPALRWTIAGAMR